ncbi:hypothetical protein [Alkalibacillus haloalkaliphilus]|uniref:hypothetical protein n=1 Tax=Alkalibacillus haloalkaliphilus TaxID=94136 RepID=UPI0002E5BE9A|nr:hypothetical protein [Alkalibacillus haloalkaliphilus]
MENWMIAVLIAVGFIVWMSLEFATDQDRGGGLRGFLKLFKQNLVVMIPLFLVGGVVYFLFFR